MDGAPGRALSRATPGRGQPGGLPAPAAGKARTTLGTRSRRKKLLARQQGMRKLCGAPIALATFEIDHVIPVSQSFSGQQQELQALCLECHRTKTSLEGNHSTTLESRFSRYAYQNYAASPRLPPLVFQLQKWDPDRPCQGIDVCRCRKKRLGQRSLPAPRLLPPGLHRSRRGGQAGGSHVDRDGLRPPQGRAGSAARRREGAGTPSPCAPTCSRWGSPSGSTSSGAWTPPRTSISNASKRSSGAWSRVGPKARSITPSSPSTVSWASSPGTWN